MYIRILAAGPCMQLLSHFGYDCIHLFDNDFKNFYLSLLHWSMYSTNHHWTSKCWSVIVHLILCPINQFIPNKFIMIQSRNKYHVRDWLNQLPQALIKPFGHVTIIILMLKHHKIHVGSAI